MSGELEAVRAVQVGVRGFAADMKVKGIHVGMGRNPRCVTCGEMWPCPSSGNPKEPQ